MPDVWVYKEDGTQQCGMGKEVSLDEMRAQLASLIGADNIVAAEKRRLPVFVSQRCGAPTASANAYEITGEGEIALFRGIIGPMGFKLWIWDAPRPASAAAGPPWPFPWLTKHLEHSAEQGAGALMNLLASANEAGSQPTTVAELKGHRCRFYKTGDVLTMDFVPARVNIEHDDGFVIKRVWFG